MVAVQSAYVVPWISELLFGQLMRLDIRLPRGRR